MGPAFIGHIIILWKSLSCQWSGIGPEATESSVRVGSQGVLTLIGVDTKLKGVMKHFYFIYFKDNRTLKSHERNRSTPGGTQIIGVLCVTKPEATKDRNAELGPHS